jgi:hypothetical protein
MTIWPNLNPPLPPTTAAAPPNPRSPDPSITDNPNDDAGDELTLHTLRVASSQPSNPPPPSKMSLRLTTRHLSI